MSAFHDEVFPLSLSQGAKVTLQQESEIVRLASGREIRNARWSSALRKWNIAGAITSAARLAELMSFFEARRGNVHAFRFRDALDFSSGSDDPNADDQPLGMGDGVRTVFPLIKIHGDVVRSITKPVPGSVRVSVGGNEVSDFDVDYLTGEITLSLPPNIGEDVRAGFLFDVPARFETPALHITLDVCRAGRAQSVTIVEVREV